MSRIRADKFVNSGANGAPELTYGAEVIAGVGLTGAGGINITGIATAASFSGATGSFTGDVDIADKIIHTGDTNTAIRFPAADTFAVETAGSERLRVDSSGRLLVGVTTTPFANDVNFQITDNTNAKFLLRNPSYGTFSLAVTNDSVLALKDEANAAERLRITSAGDVQILSGNLKFTTAGKGIDFSATSDGGGMTSELLDDYEEGTWTPTVTASGGTITSATASGEYTKIGNIVRFQLSITISNVGSGTGTLISTLPFNPANANWAASGAEDVTAGYTCIVFGNGTNVFIRKYDYSTAIVNGHRLKIAGTFQV